MALYFYQLRSNVLNTFLLHLHCDLRWWSSTMYLYFIHWSIELLIGLLVVGVYLEIAMPRIMLHSIIIVYSSHHSLNNRFINTILNLYMLYSIFLKESNTPLIWAIRSKYLPLAYKLMDNGAKIEAKNKVRKFYHVVVKNTLLHYIELNIDIEYSRCDEGSGCIS